jgi:hypothetical protein
VADRVYAAVHDMQAAHRDPVADETAAEPKVQELSPAEDTVLDLRDLADQPVHSVLSPYFGPKSKSVRHGGQRAP